MLTSVRDERTSTFSSFKSLIAKIQVPSEGPSQDLTPDGSGAPPQNTESETRSPHSSQEESGSDGGPKDRESVRGSRYKLSLDDDDELLNAIYVTPGIEKEKVQMSKHDLMYEEMHKKKARLFPVHSSLLDTIKLEWENPEKNIFSGNLKKRFPFEEKGTLRDLMDKRRYLF